MLSRPQSIGLAISQDYKRWQRDEPMQPPQLDVTGSVFLANGTEPKLIPSAGTGAT